MRVFQTLRKRRWLFLIGICAIILVAVSTFKLAGQEPTYQGKTASKWSKDTYGEDYLKTREAREAFREMGVDAIPFLFGEVKRNNGLAINIYRAVWPKMPARLQLRMHQPKKPELHLPRKVGRALASIGPDAIPRLIAGLSSFTADIRVASAVALNALGDKAAPALPSLIKATTDPNGLVRLYAVLAMGKIGPIDTAVIPTLVKSLKDNDKGPNGPNHTVNVRIHAAMALASFGSEANSAIPELKRLLAVKNSYTRVMSTISLWKLTKDTNLIEIMIKELESTINNSGRRSPSGQLMTPIRPRRFDPHNRDIQLKLIDTFGEMGSLAKGAIPTILKLLEQGLDANPRMHLIVPKRGKKALLQIDPDLELPWFLWTLDSTPPPGYSNGR